MKRIGMKASEGLELTGMGGLVLVGALLKRFTSFQASFNTTMTKGPGGIPFGDVLIPGLAMLCTGKSDFEAVSHLRGSTWAARALQVGRIASPETLRQNLDLLGERALPVSREIIESAMLDVLRNTGMKPSPLWSGHVALDIDTSPHDNSKTKKQGIGRTYDGGIGYCPILAYAGVEGFLIGSEFRTGTQHSQKGAPAFITEQIQRLRGLGVGGSDSASLGERERTLRASGGGVLVRLDSGFDAADTMLAIRAEAANFIISFNPRGEGGQVWLDQAKALPASAWIRLKDTCNLRVAYLTLDSRQRMRCLEERVEFRRNKAGQEVLVRRIVRVKKRLEAVVAEEGGHTPILGRQVVFEVGSSWSTNLDLPAPGIARLYEDHGTSEQFHSELKGELDLERLPSGKFNTNALVFHLGGLAYNLLRVLAIKGKGVFQHRHTSKRRRLKTVIQELILVPARFLGGSGQMKLDLGKAHPSRDAILALHRELVPPLLRAA